MSRHRDGGAAGPAVAGLLGLVALALGAVLLTVGLAAQVPDPSGPSAPLAGGHAGHRSAEHEPPEQEHQSPDHRAPKHQPAENRAAESGTTADDASIPSGTSAQTRARGISPPAGGAEEGVDALPASRPLAVRVPAIDVSGPLHALGLAADGTLEVPSGDRVDQAAWYSGSPTPGETGPAVVEGHVTGPGGRPSVFFELGRLGPGDRVEVDREDGTTVVFQVYRVDRYPKDRFPTVEVYGQTAGPELRLITCGGEFDESTGHHVDNTVVYARAFTP